MAITSEIERPRPKLIPRTGKLAQVPWWALIILLLFGLIVYFLFTSATYQDAFFFLVAGVRLRHMALLAAATVVLLPVAWLGMGSHKQGRITTWREQGRMFDGAREALDAVRRSGLGVGLATSSSRAEVEDFIGRFELGSCFDVTLSLNDVVRAKPDPEIYLLVAEELGVSPEECLVLEDSPSGVKAALAAGMNVVAVSTPFTRKGLHETALLPPEHVVDDPGQFVCCSDIGFCCAVLGLHTAIEAAQRTMAMMEALCCKP